MLQSNHFRTFQDVHTVWDRCGLDQFSSWTFRVDGISSWSNYFLGLKGRTIQSSLILVHIASLWCTRFKHAVSQCSPLAGRAAGPRSPVCGSDCETLLAPHRQTRVSVGAVVTERWDWSPQHWSQSIAGIQWKGSCHILEWPIHVYLLYSEDEYETTVSFMSLLFVFNKRLWKRKLFKWKYLTPCGVKQYAYLVIVCT